MISQDFLRALDRLSIKINKRTTSHFLGERSSVYKGHGLIFADRRDYTPGDDPKGIDWKAYARTGDLLIKLFEAERNMTTHIIIDFSASMGFGKSVSKVDYASMLGLGFAYLSLRKNEKFVLSTFSDQLDVFKPKKGKILNPEGDIIGEHDGIYYYTLGQRIGPRFGIEVSKLSDDKKQLKRWYVAKKILKTNTIIAAPEGHPVLLRKNIILATLKI